MIPSIITLPVNQIIVDEPNRLERNILEDGVLLELKENVEKYGVKVPLLVTEYEDGTYHLVDGYRRLQVVKSLEYFEVICVLTDREFATEVALSVNIHREDLTVVEVGQLLLKLYTQNKKIDSKFKFAKLCSIVHKSKAYISQHISYVNKLSEEIQQDIVDNKRMIDKNILTRIYMLDEESQKNIYDEMISENLGREAVQKLIDELGNKANDTQENQEILDNKIETNSTLLISNDFIELRINENMISDDDFSKFEDEFKILLKKYNLNMEA